MNRSQLEHLVRAAAAVTNEYEFIVIGSQSVLGAFPDAPADLLVSEELDIYPRDFSQKKLDLIDGSIGEGSPFHDAFHCYAQGVGPETATLPKGWEDRLVLVQNAGTDLKSAWCIDPLDLAASKLVANRPKDRRFVSTMLAHAMITETDLLDRINSLPLSPEDRARIQADLPRPSRLPSP